MKKEEPNFELQLDGDDNLVHVADYNLFELIKAVEKTGYFDIKENKANLRVAFLRMVFSQRLHHMIRESLALDYSDEEDSANYEHECEIIKSAARVALSEPDFERFSSDAEVIGRMSINFFSDIKWEQDYRLGLLLRTSRSLKKSYYPDAMFALKESEFDHPNIDFEDPDWEVISSVVLSEVLEKRFFIANYQTFYLRRVNDRLARSDKISLRKLETNIEQLSIPRRIYRRIDAFLVFMVNLLIFNPIDLLFEKFPALEDATVLELDERNQELNGNRRELANAAKILEDIRGAKGFHHMPVPDHIHLFATNLVDYYRARHVNNYSDLERSLNGLRGVMIDYWRSPGFFTPKKARRKYLPKFSRLRAKDKASVAEEVAVEAEVES